MTGNRERLQAVLGGADWEAVTQVGVREEYRLRRVGEGVAKGDAIDRSAFADFFHARPGTPERFAVAQFTDAERALFGVDSATLWLSRTSLDEHKAKHPDVGWKDYLAIPDIVHAGEVWGGHKDRRYLLLHIAGKPYRAAIKASQDQSDAWFLSLVISPKQKPPKGAALLRKATGGPGWRP